MSVEFVSQLFRSSVYHILLLASPVLLVAVLVGLIISIFQATTSIQEQTLTFVPKIFAILVVLALLFVWMSNVLGNYTIDIFKVIPQIARMN